MSHTTTISKGLNAKDPQMKTIFEKEMDNLFMKKENC